MPEEGVDLIRVRGGVAPEEGVSLGGGAINLVQVRGGAVPEGAVHRGARGQLMLASTPMAMLVESTQRSPTRMLRPHAFNWEPARARLSPAVFLRPAVYEHHLRCLTVHLVRQHTCRVRSASTRLP